MSLHSTLPPSVIPLTCILVENAYRALQKPKFEKSDAILLGQSFRLLEMYRYDAFDWQDAHKHEDAFEYGAHKQDQEAIKAALHRTGDALFPGLTPEEIIVPVETEIHNFYANKKGFPDDAKKFFARLLVELRAENEKL